MLRYIFTPRINLFDLLSIFAVITCIANGQYFGATLLVVGTAIVSDEAEDYFGILVLRRK